MSEGLILLPTSSCMRFGYLFGAIHESVDNHIVEGGMSFLSLELLQ
jgi:hypothetical protein